MRHDSSLCILVGIEWSLPPLAPARPRVQKPGRPPALLARATRGSHSQNQSQSRVTCRLRTSELLSSHQTSLSMTPAQMLTPLSLAAVTLVSGGQGMCPPRSPRMTFVAPYKTLIELQSRERASRWCGLSVQVARQPAGRR